MNPEIKAKWIAALLSGEYEQGQAVLKRSGDVPTFCCLGVLCDIHAKETNQAWERIEHSTVQGDTYLGSEHVPAGEVLAWAGLRQSNPTIKVEGLFCNDLTYPSIAELNDYYKYSFDQIAKVIEEQL